MSPWLKDAVFSFLVIKKKLAWTVASDAKLMLKDYGMSISKFIDLLREVASIDGCDAKNELAIFAGRQGLTLVHFVAQLEPCITQETTLHTLNTP